VKRYVASADASHIYHEGTSADYASVDSSAVCGNWADLMRDAIVVIPAAVLQRITLPVVSFPITLAARAPARPPSYRARTPAYP
jgi:hypothetical protein